MSPAMVLVTSEANKEDKELVESQLHHKGVKHLCERGITKVPKKYIFPRVERPNAAKIDLVENYSSSNDIKLPIIDFAQLLGPNRTQVLDSLAKACEEYGFFQLVNHGIPNQLVQNMNEVSHKFFELPFEERSKYMSKDMRAPVRYGTSYNQNNDRVFCWRDFLKLNCTPLASSLPFWPSSPTQLREAAVNYSKETKSLYLKLVEAILESLGITRKEELNENNNQINDYYDNQVKELFEEGSQLLMVNFYPSCPEPDLTLGMPPHSDYGFLTLLLQDQLVSGLQIYHKDRWLNVEPIPNSFVVNVGDHLEIFSNGRYKSILHRVLVNESKSRISIASLHSLPFESIIRPSPMLINEKNPRLYRDTNFANFLEHISSFQHANKNFLESRKLITT